MYLVVSDTGRVHCSTVLPYQVPGAKFPQEKAITGTPVGASLYLPPEEVVNVDEEDVSDDDSIQDDQKKTAAFKQFQQFMKIQKK